MTKAEFLAQFEESQSQIAALQAQIDAIKAGTSEIAEDTKTSWEGLVLRLPCCAVWKSNDAGVASFEVWHEDSAVYSSAEDPPKHEKEVRAIFHALEKLFMRWDEGGQWPTPADLMDDLHGLADPLPENFGIPGEE